ncbi:MAG TPA: hypothetical protein VHO84_11095 [Syntrophorhabdaceae bacterium]|nr:hypothetical protein [Syntrophorhabdaceae bacterium]
MDPECELHLAKKAIRKEDVERVIAHAEETGNMFFHKDNAHCLACLRLDNTTYWVEFSRDEDVSRVLAVYSHRMLILDGFNMPARKKEISDWFCFKCKAQLELARVKLTYLGEMLVSETFVCPTCGRVSVGREDTEKRMALAEKMLEDK